MKAKILITGVNGFVGRYIAKTLFLNNDVYGISRYSVNTTGLPIKYFSIDLGSEEAVSTLCSLHFDIIIHCAAAKHFNNECKDIIDTNIRGVFNVVKLCRSTACQHFIYISGIPIIGDVITSPIIEEHPVYPTNFYHLSKYIGELAADIALDNIVTTVIRIPSPIGEGMPSNKILPVFIKQSLQNSPITLLGTGKRVQNYINVKDVAIAILKVIATKARGIYNIADFKSYSNLEVAQLCIEIFHSQSQIIFSGVDIEEENKWVISIDKAISTFDFHPTISLETSILEIANSYQ